MSDDGGLRRKSVEDGRGEVVLDVSENESLLKHVCWSLEKKGRKEAFPEVCENEKREAGGADSLAEK